MRNDRAEGEIAHNQTPFKKAGKMKVHGENGHGKMQKFVTKKRWDTGTVGQHGTAGLKAFKSMKKICLEGLTWIEAVSQTDTNRDIVGHLWSFCATQPKTSGRCLKTINKLLT